MHGAANVKAGISRAKESKLIFFERGDVSLKIAENPFKIMTTESKRPVESQTDWEDPCGEKTGVSWEIAVVNGGKRRLRVQTEIGDGKSIRTRKGCPLAQKNGASRKTKERKRKHD